MILSILYAAAIFGLRRRPWTADERAAVNAIYVELGYPPMPCTAGWL